MKLKSVAIFRKVSSEPPITAAFITIAFFSLPVIVSMLTRGYILLPGGFTYNLIVQPIYGVAAILLNLVLLYLFCKCPIITLGFHRILTPDFVRKLLIIIYLLITWVSFYVINAKLNFFNSLLSDPIPTMLNVGSGLVEEKLLKSFFFGISGCIGFALTKENDGVILRFSSFLTMLAIALFYFFVGRREISLMTLCFLLLVKRDKIGRGYMIIIGSLLAAILIFVLSIRIAPQSDSESIYATNSEELSPIAYSSYVIQTTTPNILKSFTQVTPLRTRLYPNTIAAAFLKDQTGYDDVATPVLGIAGITYMYGFIVPVGILLMIGVLFRSITNEYKIKRTPVIKLMLIYITFKSINLFRNGEFPIVTIDIVLFFILSLPALFLTFAKRREAINHE